ncbi:MAG: two-component system sensor histidine kinase NtrB, partial [Woeseiaceae bacterium]
MNTQSQFLATRRELFMVLVPLGGVYALFIAQRWTEARPDNWAQFVPAILITLAAGIRSLITARHITDRRKRAAWVCFGLAAISWNAAAVCSVYVILRIPGFDFNYSLPSQFLFSGYVSFFLIGLYLLNSTTTVKPVRWLHITNLVLLACALVICFIVMLLNPLIESGAPINIIAFSVFDPTALLIALSFAFTMLFLRELRALRYVVVLLCFAIALYALSELGYYSNFLATGQSAEIIELLYAGGFAAHYWAAYEQDNLTDAGAAPTADKAEDTLQVLLPPLLIALMLTVAVIYRANITNQALFVMAPVILIFLVVLAVRDRLFDRVAKSFYQDLKTAHKFTTQLIASSPVVSFVLDATDDAHPLTFVSENAEAILGLDGAALRDPESIHPDDRKYVSAQYDSARKAGSASFEYRILDDDGKCRWIDQRMIMSWDDNGNPLQIVGSIFDITPQKELESQAQQTQRLEALGQLSGSVAHDFNNLLTAILGFSTMLKQSKNLSESDHEHLAQIITGGNRAAELTQKLLAFSSKQAIRLNVIDVNSVLSSMTAILNQLVGETIQIDIRPSAILVAVRAERSQLEQVLMNLVINARDAMPNGGQITVEVDEQYIPSAYTPNQDLAGTCAVISVSDTGCGIEESVRERMFEPFFTTKQSGKGTGLGLSTIHGIVQQHNGHI